MKLKKRSKRTRIRGGITCGWGFRQKHRGSGHRGGVGMAGSGKRADHKKQKALELGGGRYFGKRGYTSKSNQQIKNKVINLDDIQKNYSGKEITLKDYKILGKGEGFNAVITADSASKSAFEKMEKAGGKIIVKPEVIHKKVEVKKVEKKNSPEEKKTEKPKEKTEKPAKKEKVNKSEKK
jgi:large subunit ribosomal protein L15